MDVLDAIKTRTTTQFFDREKSLSDAEIKELAEFALEAPSSFNLQQTRLIAVTDPQAKERLKAAAWNQPKVADAAATFIILGDLGALDKHPELIERAMRQGVVPEPVGAKMIKGARDYYSVGRQRIHEEAIRSASLAAMNLMLAAHAKGYGCGPMIGFDADKVKAEFNIPDRYVVVLLIAVGYALPGNPARKPRLTVDEALSFNTCGSF